MGARMRFIGRFVSPFISDTHRRFLASFYIHFIEQRKGIGVIAVKNGLDNLLFFLMFLGGYSFHIKKVHPKHIQYKMMKN